MLPFTVKPPSSDDRYSNKTFSRVEFPAAVRVDDPEQRALRDRQVDILECPEDFLGQDLLKHQKPLDRGIDVLCV